MKYITYIGSYTDADHADGVRIYESDAETGAFAPLGALNTFESPTPCSGGPRSARPDATAASPRSP